MGKFIECIEAAVGFNEEGLPASTTQFTFGHNPFQIDTGEDMADQTNISLVCQCDVPVDIQVIDQVPMVSFDFSAEDKLFVELVNELQMYNEQKDHVTTSINKMMNEYAVADENNDVDKRGALLDQMKTMNVPFMLPTIVPLAYGGTTYLGFLNDPKFVMFTTEDVYQRPFKITMIFAASDLFLQDESGVLFEDTESEMESMQEELWYMEEAKKMEEAAYQEQFGSLTDYYAEEDETVDKRLKGVRVK